MSPLDLIKKGIETNNMNDVVAGYNILTGSDIKIAENTVPATTSKRGRKPSNKSNGDVRFISQKDIAIPTNEDMFNNAIMKKIKKNKISAKRPPPAGKSCTKCGIKMSPGEIERVSVNENNVSEFLCRKCAKV